jgi:hypothetical protein
MIRNNTTKGNEMSYNALNNTINFARPRRKENDMTTTQLWPNATLGKYKHIWKDDRGVERLAVCMEEYGVRHCKVRFVGHRGKEIYGTGIVTVWTNRLAEF